MKRPFALLNRFIILGYLVLPIVASHVNGQVKDLYKCAPGQECIALAKLDIWQDPETIFQPKADSIDRFAQQRDLPILVAFYRLIRTTALASHTTGIQEKLRLFNQYRQQVKTGNTGEMQGACYMELAQCYFDVGDFEQTFANLVRARDVFDHIGYNTLAFGAYYTHNLFRFYMRFEDYKTALHFGKLNLALNDSFPFTKAYKLNNIGVTYLKLKQYDSALAMFKRVMEVSPGLDEVHLGIGNANYGNVLRLTGRYSEALPYLYRELELVPVAAHEDCAITCLYIADCLLHLDSIAKAKVYIDKAPTYSPNMVYSDYMLHYLNVMVTYLKKTKQFESASLYQDKLSHVKDSLRNFYSTQLSLATELQAKEEKLLLEQRQREAETRHVVFVRNASVIGIVLVFLFVLFYLNEKRKKAERLQVLKRKQTEQQLQLAQEKLEQYVASIKEKNAFIEKIEQELAAHRPERMMVKAEDPVQVQLEHLQRAVILTEEDWEKFKQLCEQVWPGLFERLHEKFPDLSRSEERVLVLSKLNISSREMAGMLGISVDSLRKSRYRLRKKYPSLAEEEEFNLSL